MLRDVQTGSRAQLVRQQQVLAHLGFYKGRIDGIWGPKTIAAKQAYESSGFAPGLPNGGMPFAPKTTLPRGLKMGGDGMLVCGGFDETKWPECDGVRARAKATGPAAPTGSLRHRPDRGVAPRPTHVPAKPPETEPTATNISAAVPFKDPGMAEAPAASPAVETQLAGESDGSEGSDSAEPLDTAQAAAKAWGNNPNHKKK